MYTLFGVADVNIQFEYIGGSLHPSALVKKVDMSILTSISDPVYMNDDM